MPTSRGRPTWGMARSEPLVEFLKSDAREVARWPTSAGEVLLWAGSAGGWPVDASVFRRWHADPDVKPYVLRAGEATVGYGELWTDESEQEVELARIIVNPDYRGRGLGKRLVGLLLERAALSSLPDAFAYGSSPRTALPSPAIGVPGSRPYAKGSARSSIAGSPSSTCGCTTP